MVVEGKGLEPMLREMERNPAIRVIGPHISTRDPAARVEGQRIAVRVKADTAAQGPGPDSRLSTARRGN